MQTHPQRLSEQRGQRKRLTNPVSRKETLNRDVRTQARKRQRRWIPTAACPPESVLYKAGFQVRMCAASPVFRLAWRDLRPLVRLDEHLDERLPAPQALSSDLVAEQLVMHESNICRHGSFPSGWRHSGHTAVVFSKSLHLEPFFPLSFFLQSALLSAGFLPCVTGYLSLCCMLYFFKCQVSFFLYQGMLDRPTVLSLEWLGLCVFQSSERFRF